jgi:ferrous-iron efflux pump FieF
LNNLISPNHASSSQEKEHSVMLGLVVGLFGLLPSVFIMLLANSTTLLSEVLKDSGLVLAIFLSWLSIRKVSKGKNLGYDYGYGKMENLSGMLTASVMIIAFGIVLYTAIDRFLNPTALNEVGTIIGLIFSGIAMIANALLLKHELHLARREVSPIMESMWRLTRVKIISFALVIISLGMSIIFRENKWAEYVDPTGSVILSCFILFSAWGVISKSVYDLLDKTLEEEMQLIILRELATYFQEYEALHGIKSRRSGAHVYIEIFLEFDGERKMAEVQKVITEMKAALEQKIQSSQVIIAPTTSPVA